MTKTIEKIFCNVFEFVFEDILEPIDPPNNEPIARITPIK
jgi:hypothetical protein